MHCDDGLRARVVRCKPDTIIRVMQIHARDARLRSVRDGYGIISRVAHLSPSNPPIIRSRLTLVSLGWHHGGDSLDHMG